MKELKYILCIPLLAAVFGLSSCSEKEGSALSGEGSLRLSVSASDKIDIVSRALSDDVQSMLQEACRIRVFSGETLVQKFEGVENIPSEIRLASGEYKATAYAGDSVAASFETCYYYGESSFTISKGQSANAEIECTIGNTVVGVSLSDEMTSMMDDYQVTVASSEGSLTYDAEKVNNGTKGYFTLSDADRSLKCTLTGTAKSGEEIKTEYTIASAGRSTLYNLNFRLSGGGSESGSTGGGKKPSLSVTTTNLTREEHDFVLTQRVTITCEDTDGLPLDLSQTQYLTKGATGTYTFHFAAYTSLTSINLSLPAEAVSNWGFGSQEIDLVASTDAQIENLKTLGIEFTKPAKADDGLYRSSLALSQSFISKLTNLGDLASASYRIGIKAVEAGTAEDGINRSREAVLNITVSDDQVQTVQNEPYEVWTRKATLRGEVISDAWTQQPKFRYRLKDSSESWTETGLATITGNTFSIEVTGLQPNTSYEYQAIDGGQPSAVLCFFTTESEFQPENPGFEYTSGTTPLYFYENGKSMWWDSGNKGSATLSKNVTTVDTSLKHGGNQSLKMESQFVGLGSFGKFAAGNIFAGEFLGTERTYYGILGWGRPCESRPTKMRVWVRYTPGTVDYGGTQIANGEMDRGIIYVAVGDWKSDDATYGNDWPVVVRTWGPKLFDPSDSGTIAYGERIFTSEIGSSSEMVQVEIPLDYDNYGGNNRKPTHIVIVASASQYGDYYLGSQYSKMWLDDIELVYE